MFKYICKSCITSIMEVDTIVKLDHIFNTEPSNHCLLNQKTVIDASGVAPKREDLDLQLVFDSPHNPLSPIPNHLLVLFSLLSLSLFYGFFFCSNPKAVRQHHPKKEESTSIYKGRRRKNSTAQKNEAGKQRNSEEGCVLFFSKYFHGIHFPISSCFPFFSFVSHPFFSLKFALFHVFAWFFVVVPLFSCGWPC